MAPWHAAAQRAKAGAGGRSRPIGSALARPHSAVEPHPQNTCVPRRIDFASLASQMPKQDVRFTNCKLTSNRTLRTRLLYALSYGDKESNSWPVSSTGSHAAPSKKLDRK